MISHRIETAARAACWLALLFATAMAVLPHPPHILGDLWDKAQHMIAFAVVAACAALGYRGTPLIRIGEHLSFLGALIEVIQSIPRLHRDCDILDWVADTMSIAAVLIVMHFVRRAIDGRLAR
jgi:VanZ family protein